MSGEQRDNTADQQESKPAKLRIAAIRLACLACLAALALFFAPQTSRSQSQSLSMHIIAGLASPGSSTTSVTWISGTCPNEQDVCILGGFIAGEGACPGFGPFTGIPTNQPGGPVPVCNFGYAGDGGPAIDALLGYPLSVAADANGNVYIAEASNSDVRKIDSSGNISTYGWIDSSGNFNLGAPPPGSAIKCVTNIGCVSGTGLGSFPRGDYPSVVAVDPQGGVHVKVVMAGTASPQPLAAVYDQSGNEYDLVEQLGAWYAVTKNGAPLFCTTSAPSCAYPVFQFDTFLTGLAVDGAGNVYTIESGENIVEMNPATGIAATLVTIPSQLSAVTPTSNVPISPLAADSKGNVYVLTNAGPNGASSVSEYNVSSQTWATIAGTGTNGFNNGNSPTDTGGSSSDYSTAVDAPSPATKTDLNNATAISVGPDGALYIADTENNMVRKIAGVASATTGGCQECGPSTLAITDTIARPLPPQWGINSALHKIYMITSKNPGVVTVFSTLDDSVIANIPIPGPGVSQSIGASTILGALAVDPVNNLVWVGDTGTNSVWVINSAADTLNPTSVALAAAPLNIAVDTALNKAYVTITNGGYPFSGSPPAISVISGPSAGNPPAVAANIGAYGSAAGALPGATAIAADPQRHLVYVRYLGPSSLGFTAYSVAIIDSTKDQVLSSYTLGQTQFSSQIFADSLAIDESTGDLMVGDDYDQYVHLYDPETQAWSGFFGGSGNNRYHVAADSVNSIFYTWDGYGNSGYLLPNQSSGPITTSSNTTAGESTVAVDQTTDQAYVLTCNSANGDGTFGTLTLFDGSGKSVQATLALEIPSGLNSETEGCGGLLVDASNTDPLKHAAWAGFSYQTQAPSSAAITNTGQIDVINGATPAARPSIDVLYGSGLALGPNPDPFQDVGIGQTATLELRIKNIGAGPLNSVSLDIQDLQDPGSLQITNNQCAGLTVAQPLPAGAQCSFDLTFTPSKVEAFTGAILVLDNAGDTPQSVGITGAGVPDVGPLTIAPNFLPPGAVGQSYGQVFSASGLVGTPTWSITGTLPPDLSFSPVLHWIVSDPNILAAADVGTWNFTISVTDSATGNTGSQPYSLTITSTTSGQATASVSIPGASGTADTLAFGSIEVNELSATEQIAIQNSYGSTANLQINSVKLAGPNVSDFTESDNCLGKSFSVNQSCILNVTFRPTVTPTANEVAEIVVGSNAPIPPIYLTGTSAPALGAPALLPVLVSADNGNPPNPATPPQLNSCYPPECGGTTGPFGNLGGVSSGGKFAAFTFLANNLPGPLAAPTAVGGAASGAYLRNTCLGAAPGTCTEFTQYIAYGPALAGAPGANGGAACENTTAGGSNGSSATGIDSTGEFVLFESDTCGFGGSTFTNANQIFLRDTTHGNTALVSVDTTGTTVLNKGASGSSTSADARFFAFQSTSTNAASGFANPNGNKEIYWRDTCLSEGSQVNGCNPQTILVSRDNAGDGFKDNSLDSSISSTGRYVAFGSYATMLNSTPATNNSAGLEQIYLYDTCAGAPAGQTCTASTKLISVDAGGNAVGGSNPRVSADGRFVSFLSTATTLLPSAYQAKDGGTAEVYLVDTCTSNGAPVTSCTAQPPILVSQYSGAPGNVNSFGASISADGQLVTFTSGAGTLPSGGIISVYEYTNCLSPAAATPCTSGLQDLSVDANGNPLQNIAGGDLLDPTGQYFIFDGQQSPGTSYGGAPEVYLAATTLVPPPPAIATFIPYPYATSIDFGTVEVSQSSPEKILELFNSGTGPLHVYLLTVVNSQTLQSAPFDLESIFCNSVPGGTVNVPETVQYAVNLTLEPGIACVFNLVMNPTASGTFNGSINFATNASASNAPFQPTFPGRSNISIPLTGTAPPQTPYATFTVNGVSAPSSGLTLQGVPINTTQSSQISVTNTGKGSLTLDQVYFNLSTPSASNGFSYTQILCGGTAASFPVTLLPNQSCIVNVQFTPAADGTFSTNLNFVDNAGAGQSNISSTGTAPNFVQAFALSASVITLTADVGIIGEPGPSQAEITGSPFIFTLGMVNNGPNVATNPVVTFSFSSPVLIDGLSIQGGFTPNCLLPPPNASVSSFTCKYSGASLAPGHPATTALTITPITSGSFTLTSIIRADQLDPNLSNNAIRSSAYFTAPTPPAKPGPVSSVSFSPAIGSPISTGNAPSAIAVADFNKDGISDIAIVNTKDNTVSIYLGSSIGTFTQAPGSPYSTTPFGIANTETPISIAVGDFNGDGNLDIAVTTIPTGFFSAFGNLFSGHIGGGVSILLGNGDGTFKGGGTGSNPNNFGTGGDLPTGIAVADFNGDGKLDLAITNLNSNNVSILLGDGKGNFGSPTLLPVGTHPAALTTFLAGGSPPNLAVANADDGTVQILFNLGGASFRPVSAINVGIRPVAITTADINGDGNADLVVANYSSSTVSVLLGNGSGTFAAPKTFPVGVHPMSVAVADLNYDGFPDLLIANNTGNQVSFLAGRGDGTFAPSQNISVLQAPSAIALGNFAGSLGFATLSTPLDSVGVYTGNVSCISGALGLTITKNSGWSFPPRSVVASETLTITNESGTNYPGPIYLVVSNLSSNAQLINPTGFTHCGVAAPSPYIAVPGALPSGASFTVTVQVSDPSRTAINFTPVYLAPGPAPFIP